VTGPWYSYVLCWGGNEPPSSLDEIRNDGRVVDTLVVMGTSRTRRRDPVPPSGPDEDARARFTALFDAHAPDLLAYVIRRLPDRTSAPDVVADVFLVAWRRMRDVPDGDAARLWLFGVARMTLQNERRSRRRHEALGERLRAELAVQPDVAGPEERDPALAAALARLRPDDRELLLLIGWDGLTPSEAAVVLGISAEAARVRVHRARGRLRQLLADEEGGSGKRFRPDGQMSQRGANVALAGLEEV
jgi:RNA polymerase sigma-70 factor (ECF subfamily)